MRAPVWVEYRNFLPFRYLLTIAAAFAKCREFFDSVPDLVLNCAAAVGEQDWERMYDVNIVSFHSTSMYNIHKCQYIHKLDFAIQHSEVHATYL